MSNGNIELVKQTQKMIKPEWDYSTWMFCWYNRTTTAFKKIQIVGGGMAVGSKLLSSIGGC